MFKMGALGLVLAAACVGGCATIEGAGAPSQQAGDADVVRAQRAPRVGQDADAGVARAQQVALEINQTERAFARTSLERGITPSFQAFIDADGVLFRPGPVRGVDALAGDVDEPGMSLDWWPVFTGASRSGDLGFSMGPWVLHRAATGRTGYGYYVTVWRRQPDGQWRFVLDGAGARISAPSTRPKGTPVVFLQPSQAGPPSEGTAAVAAVGALDDALNEEAQQNSVTALSRFLADDAWVMGSDVEVAPGREAWATELARRPTQISYRRLGGGGSASGDIVYMYGSAVANVQGVVQNSHYLRIWSFSEDRWSIVIDTLSPDN